MNQHLQTLLNFIQHAKGLSDDEKNAGYKAVKAAEKELETRNRDLEIEAALERVRAVAMSMMKSDELLNVCESVFRQLQALGFSEDVLRNSQIVINDDARGLYYGYQYSDLMGGEFAEVPYNLHPVIKFLNDKLRQSNEAFADIVITGESLDDWKKFVNNFPQKRDDKLNAASELHYYFYSVGIGALGISTFRSITEEQLEIIKRFRNVFDLSYKRYTDIALAEAQARQAQIEVALERVRSKAMAMHKSDDFNSAVATVFEELDKLNLGVQRCGIGILNKETYKVDLWTTAVSDHGNTVQVSGDESMDIHPLLHGAYDSWLRQEDFSYVLKGEDLVEYYRALTTTNFILPDSVQTTSGKEGQQQYYFNAMFEAGGLFAFRETEFPEEAKSVMKRFAGVFNLTYKRFLDLQKAEAQTRESQIQLALERVRARTMAMQKSDELEETSFILFQQLKELGADADQLSIVIIRDEDQTLELYSTFHGSKLGQTYIFRISDQPVLEKIFNEFKSGKKSVTFILEGKELREYNQWRNTLSEVNFSSEHDRWIMNMGFFSRGYISMSYHEPVSTETIQLLERFAGVFDLTYTRFLDLKQAEAQTRKAQIEAGMERVRGRALAMQEPEELIEVANVLRQEMGLLGLQEIETGTVFIFDEAAETAHFGFTMKDTRFPEKESVTENITVDLNTTTAGKELLRFFRSQEIQCSIRQEGEKRKEWVEYLYLLSPKVNNYFGGNIQDKMYHLYKFSNGAVGATASADISAESWDLLKRAASVFSLAYSRFKDLTKARIDLQNLKDEKKRSDSLLLNILPEEIANELKQFGKSYARKHDQVTILFADIKGFSSIAENLSAEELVNQLDECFRAFDHIVEKHGMEKIKTIGDAYVCACGLPKPVFDNAGKTVRAALDMLDFIKGFGMTKRIQDLPAFEFRVGIHTGPVVTGVVGLKKFTYDIWGDAVNMAARMEQHGEAGRINISGSTHQLIKDKFICTYRGKIPAKNKGEVDMYFVERSN